MKKLLSLCAFVVVVCTGIEAKAQRLFQEVYGTLFNTGLYITEDVYARQFHERSAATGNKLRLVHIAEAFYNSGVFHPGNDSTTLVYSGVRGWDSVLDEWAYDTLNNFIVSLPMWKEYDTSRLSKNYYAFNQHLPQRRVFTYASNGKLGTYTHEELKGGSQWVPTAEFSYSYDATYRRIQQASADEAIAYHFGIDNMKSIEISKNNSGTWKVSHGMYYHYDTIYGRVERIVHANRLPNGNNFETGSTAYQYGGNGKVIAMYRITNRSLLVKDTVRTSYDYNDSGYITSMITQKVKNGLDSNIQRVEIRYNYMHQVVSERQQYWSKGGQMWMYEKEKRYHYQTIWPVNVADKQKDNAPDVQLYPTPAKGSVTVSLNDAGTGNATMTLMNMNGALLRKWQYSNMGSSYKQELSLGDMPAGTYMMRIETETGAVTKKLVLE